MSNAVNALAMLDAQLKDRAERAARYDRHADKAAAKLGARQVTADRMADHAKVLLAELLAVRAAVAELIAADSEYDRARAAWLADHSKHNEFLAAREAWNRRAAALARVKGEAA